MVIGELSGPDSDYGFDDAFNLVLGFESLQVGLKVMRDLCVFSSVEVTSISLACVVPLGSSNNTGVVKVFEIFVLFAFGR